MQLSTTEHEQLYAILQQYDENPQVQRMREFIQHGDVTTYQHCKNVVRVSFWLNRRLHLHADETSLAVGAFLHDFYLYDWHKRSTFHGLRRLFEMHGFSHPGYACVNAQQVFHITKKEQTSPNDKTRAPQTGNFATAWIDHGRAPKQAAYEYAVYIQPTNKEITRLIKKDGYEVLRRDNTANVVKDLATGITGYVCFGEYTGQGLVRKATGESIVMERTATDGQVGMSVCTPDLGLTEKTYTTRQERRPIEKEVLLAGAWELAAQYPGGEAVSHDTGTLLKKTCRHGQPVEFRLKKK